MEKRIVRFYRKANGDCPVEAFLDSLPEKTAAKIAAVLKLVEQQKTPRAEIRRAEQYREDYLRRLGR